MEPNLTVILIALSFVDIAKRFHVTLVEVFMSGKLYAALSSVTGG
jgi:hypothetical protein